MAFVEKKPGIGPVERAATGQNNMPVAGSAPFTAPAECPGPALWSADDNDRQSGAWASPNFQNVYWTTEPTQTMPAPAQGLEPTSDTTGSNPLPGGAVVGDYGDPPKVVPYADPGGGGMENAARPDINNLS
jgi:hypothetical protein